MDARATGPSRSPAASQVFREHKEVLESLGDFRTALDLGRPEGELRRMLAGFVATAGRHFASEEALMRSSGYHAVGAHVAEHQRLFGQLQTVKDEFASGAIHPCGALALFVEVWTAQHIQLHDKPFIEYLNAAAADGR